VTEARTKTTPQTRISPSVCPRLQPSCIVAASLSLSLLKAHLRHQLTLPLIDGCTDDFTAQQLAAELTRKEQQLFVAIPPSEFLEKLGFGPHAAPADAGKPWSCARTVRLPTRLTCSLAFCVRVSHPGQAPDEDKTPLISAFVEHFNNVRDKPLYDREVCG
jgi:hypothetical protein